jgi:hypothetical protein
MDPNEKVIMAILFTIGFIGLSISALGQPIIMGALWHRLRNHFHDQWVDLGSPAILMNQGVRATLRTRRLSRREFRELGDPPLRRLAVALVWIERIGYVSLLVFIAGIIGMYA